MAVAAPVLERKVNTDDQAREQFGSAFMTADERHNACISANYAKLINPETTLKDFGEKEAVRVENNYAAPEAQEIRTESLYLVENARADADIFRADSAINTRTVKVENTAAVQEDEEENEDLRPTQTTIQYKTTGAKQTAEEGKISTKAPAKTLFTKKDKIIIVVAISVILALFVLIIVNSAIISSLNSEVSALQNNLVVAESDYLQVATEKANYLNEENLFDTVSNFAQENGMFLR